MATKFDMDITEQEILQQFYDKLLSEQKDIEPELVEMVDNNFWELLL